VVFFCRTELSVDHAHACWPWDWLPIWFSISVNQRGCGGHSSRLQLYQLSGCCQTCQLGTPWQYADVLLLVSKSSHGYALGYAANVDAL
jgi:hypothetical protein